MTASLLIAFDGSAAAEAAVRAAGALFPGARATVLTIHEPTISPATPFRAGGALVSPEIVERSLTELQRELVAEAEAAAADGARLAEAVGLGAEPAVPRRTPAVGADPRRGGRARRRGGGLRHSRARSRWPALCSARPRRACCTTLTGPCWSFQRRMPRPTGRRSSRTTDRPPPTRRSRSPAGCCRAGPCRSFTPGSRRFATRCPAAP